MKSDFLLTQPPFHPFGTRITCEHIIAQLNAACGWEDKYRLLIGWGKLLPPLADEMKHQQEIAGCESQVWLYTEWHADRLYFAADSDARIVKGLLAMVLAAVESKTASQILNFDFKAFFEKSGLQQQLSATRAAGISAIINTITTLAATPHS